jgi:hypothetical protein
MCTNLKGGRVKIRLIEKATGEKREKIEKGESKRGKSSKRGNLEIGATIQKGGGDKFPSI